MKKHFHTRHIFPALLFLFSLLFFTETLWAQSSETPLDQVCKVAGKVLEETSFDYKWKVAESNSNINLINLENNSLNGKNLLYIYARIGSDENIKTKLSIACSGHIDIYLNNSLIGNYKNADYHFREYCYNEYAFNLNIPVSYKKGINELLICLKSPQPVKSLPLILSEFTYTSDIQLVSLTDNAGETKWLFCGPVPSTRDLISQGPVLTGFKPGYTIGGEYYPWHLPAPILIREFDMSKQKSFLRDSYADWHYANGNTLMAIYNLYETSGNTIYRDHVRTYLDAFISGYSYFADQYRNNHIVRGAYHRFFRMTMLDDTGGPGLVYAEFSRKENIHQYDSILNSVLHYVMNVQERLSDGTFSRPEPEAKTLWADDLFMSTPFLLRMAKLTGKEELYNEVSEQIIRFNHYLQNPETGLYYHGWYHNRKQNTPVQWGRANGWVIWAETEALLNLPKNHPRYKEIKKIYTNHINALIRVQNPNGMWNQVLDKPETYDETSATAMFTMAIARGINEGWLGKKYTEYALRGWKAVEKKIDADGTVHGICRGTGIGEDVAFYQNRKTFDHDPRGLGAVITAGIEINKLTKK